MSECAALLLLSASTSVVLALEPGEPAPKLSSESNSDPSSPDFKGKVFFLDFWASWCAPCSISLPWISGLTEAFEASEFQIVSVNIDKNRSAADKLLANLHVNIPVIYDPEQKIASQYDLVDMPSSFLISRDGKILSIHHGFRESDKAEIIKEIKAALVRQ